MTKPKPMTVQEAGRRSAAVRNKKLSPARRKEIATKASHSRTYKKSNNG